VATLIRQLQPQVIITPGPFDLHSDHWATYNFVRLAAAQTGWDRKPGHALYCYLVHAGSWPAPRGLHRRLALEPPAALATANLRWVRLPLTPEEVTTKTLAVREYRSQAPQWDRLLLALVRSNELFAEMRTTAPRDELLVTESPGHERPAMLLHPGADLLGLSARRAGEQGTVALTLAGKPAPALTYTVTGHAADHAAPDAWSATYRDGLGTLSWVAAGRVQQLPLNWRVQGNTLTAAIPCSFLEGKPLLLEGGVRRKQRYLDHLMPGPVDLSGQCR